MGRVVSEPVLGSSLSQEVEKLTSSSSDLNGRHRRVALGVGRFKLLWRVSPASGAVNWSENTRRTRSCGGKISTGKNN